MFPSSLEEEIPAGHIVRGLRSLVEEAACSLRLSYEDHGGVPYDPVGLLCVLLYGFMQGVSSSRSLEEACLYDARFKYLARGLRPDHNTISRFRLRLAEELPAVFARSLDIARERGLLGLKVVAVDGTKIQGSVSQWGRLVRGANEEEAGFSDPDARLMRDRRKGIVRGYNAQTAVDETAGLVAGYEVSNRAKDDSEMAGVLDSVERSCGSLPDAAVADAGYDSATNHAALEERGVEGVVAPHAPSDSFWSVGENGGEVLCPAGHAPRLARTSHCGGVLYDHYEVDECSGCPLRAGCSPRRRKRLAVRAGASPALRVLNAHRALGEEGRELLKKRKSIVEPVFGHMKANRGFRRFSLRGLAKARIEFGLACLSHNLERIIRAMERLFRLLGRLASPSRRSVRRRKDSLGRFRTNYRRTTRTAERFSTH